MQRRSIPKSVRKIIYQKYGGRCAYCGCELEYKDMQVDHVQSVYWNNGDNEIKNLMPACRMCNFYKSTYSVEKFRELTDRLEKTFIYRLAKKYGIVVEQKEPMQFYCEKVDVKSMSRRRNDI